MKKCYFCGSDVPDNAKFCPKCGKTIEITQNLIDQAKGNDPNAQTELYERTYRLVYSRIRAKVPDDDTAVDIMQETYLRAFTSLDQLQNAETFPSWLLTIANRQTCDWYRKNEKENENVQMSQMEYVNDDTISNEDDLLEEYEYREDFSPEESLDREETGRLLSEILDTLPEDQRIILTMRYYDEMSLQEISEELGVNLSTVKSRLTSGKKKVEAKVLELEKSGTKLYSLGPIAFLVFLLHHAEMFAPAISANTVIGLTAAGAAGIGAGGAVAAHVTAGAAAKTAVAAAAKGISVKVVAIVAAAVIIVGGGTTATVVAVNNSQQSSEAAGAEQVETSQATTVELTPDEMPAEEAKTKPSEEPEGTEVLEEPSEEESDQQEPELAGEEEETVAAPSEDEIHALVDSLSFWSINTMSESSNMNNPITPTLNQAAELAAAAYFWENRNQLIESSDIDLDTPSVGWAYILPENSIRESLRNRFGSEYNLSDFTNTIHDGVVTSAFGAGDEIGNYLGFMLLTNNGHYEYDELGTDNLEFPDEVTIKSVAKSSQKDDYVVNIAYNYSWMDYEFTYNDDYTEETVTSKLVQAARDVEYILSPNDNSDSGWVITQITYLPFYEK